MELFLIAHVAGRGVAIEAGQVDSVVDLGETVAAPRAERRCRPTRAGR